MSVSCHQHPRYHSLALASLGWDVLATDIASVVNSVLRPNIARNGRMLRETEPFIETEGTTRCGNVQVRELDWSVHPSRWCWDDYNGVAIAAREDGQSPAVEGHCNEELLAPPFDLVVTSDTVYSTSLVTPLLRTLHQVCSLSRQDDNERRHLTHRPPPVYIAVENRDPGLLASFFKQARDEWGFTTTRIPDRRVERAMERKRMDWKREDWMGVEVWKLQLQQTIVTQQT